MIRHPLATRLIRRVEAVTLAVIIVTAGALWAFVALASEMLEGDLHAFDEAILLALRNPDDPADPIGGGAVEIAMRDLTALGGVTVLALISLTVLSVLLLKRQSASALLLSAAISGGLAVSTVAKSTFSRPRPDLVPHGVDAATASFPSGHSMMAAVTYLTLAVMLTRIERQSAVRALYVAVAALVTILIGASRVYMGVHWPSDVLAGWTLGAAWALGLWLLARHLARRGRIEPEEPCDA
ncbi:PA-phosphatase related phosphoesterase [Pseudooceanicola batsensis HTCC2597]|uniref:PA-phosphatase related phosphoesterase n=1 Tax=Pseudooceanicola batsensis (strain ATCC BAA-863 / DSM 15984 / KCTC 12145 / HTCC2597) TaxID=252305 RepID=A3TWT4_PSEBH|nr:phosphatase PAP2 family protein [Pseudooceanicola batsensis]EAQ03294.1 PA-phosphatase related phosphoesterase [Pseudooceanicola batsensis HTCC2597]